MSHWTADTANIPAAVHARLLEMAKAEGVPFNTVAIRYVTERLLYRLSCSDYSDRFVLKGAWLFYLWEMPRRTTRDVDFLGYGENSVEYIEEAFRRISQIEVTPDDGLDFDPESIAATRLRETEEYSGVRIRLNAFLGNGRYTAQVDVGFGDALVEKPMEGELPVLLDFPPPRLRAYNPEASIAEKLEAVVRFGARNSRMRDYFDLFTLSRERHFDGTKLQTQISATFSRRETALPSTMPTGFGDDFARERQRDWDRFLDDSAGTAVPRDFGRLIQAIRDFAYPPLHAAADQDSFPMFWDPEEGWSDKSGR